MVALPETYEYRFTCLLPNGIHARPASCLEQVVSRFSSQVSITNLNNSRVANARSVLSLVGADIKAGDECVLKVDGNDSDGAYQEIVRFLQNELPSCDNLLPASVSQTKEVYIPPVLRAAGVPVLPASPVVSGFGRGYIVFVEEMELPETIVSKEITDTQQELRKIDFAIAAVRTDITLKLGTDRISAAECEILKAHLSIAGDTELHQKIYNIIKEQHVCAGKAIIQSLEYFSKVLKLAQSKLIQERVADLKDICSQLFNKIYDSATHGRLILSRPSICIADNMTPSEFIAMDKNLLSGLVLRNGGNTSHTAILARSFGIPTLTNLADTDNLLENGQDVIVDANYGLLVVRINEQVERFYAFEKQKRDIQQQQLMTFKDNPVMTRDGATIKVMANVSLAQEIPAAMLHGAQGVGLFRTEMLYMGRQVPPDEQEQFEEYKKAAICADSKPVIIRTFDLGGDKIVPYLNPAKAENSPAEYRGVDIYKQHEELFIDQLRAILRASAFGNLKIMVPMVACAQDVMYVRDVLERVMAWLDSRSIRFNRNIPLGIMVEIPSVVSAIPQIAHLINFLSIGTNDLIQYHLALDRGDKQINSLYQARHPSVLALIKKIADIAHTHRLRPGMCGEMAGQIEYLPLLLGTGLEELSMAIPQIMKVKAQCPKLDSRECHNMLRQAIHSKTIEQVTSILSEYNTQTHEKSVIDLDLIGLDADCMNREESIKYISDKLFAYERTQNPVELEKDFWRREQVYSTGLGFGFAIPHCKTAHVNANSICVLRLRQPIAWGAADDKPVDTIIGMTIRDTDQAANIHMKIFSKLARNIMHEDFRQQLREFRTAADIAAYLDEKLELEK